SRPTSDFRKTDLPVPEGPNRTLISPGGSVSVTSRQMVWAPKDLDSPSTTTSTPIVTSASSSSPVRGHLPERELVTCDALNEGKSSHTCATSSTRRGYWRVRNSSKCRQICPFHKIKKVSIFHEAKKKRALTVVSARLEYR